MCIQTYCDETRKCFFSFLNFLISTNQIIKRRYSSNILAFVPIKLQHLALLTCFVYICVCVCVTCMRLHACMSLW